jgi:hypothetical protein
MWTWPALCAAWASSAAAAPFEFTRDLPILARPSRVDADNTGDGVDELMAWWSPLSRQELIDGRTGAVLRTWTGTVGDSPTPGLGLLPDVTGDGRSEFLFADRHAGRVFAVPSQSSGGRLGTIPTLWELNGVALGEDVAVTSGQRPRALAGAGSSGRVVVADPATGSVLARISRDPSTLDVAGFGSTVADAGDLNGDGVHDFAVGAPGRYTVPRRASEGRIYLIDGRVTTAAGADTPVTQLGNQLLGVVRSTSQTSLGVFGGAALANLGDPLPGDGVPQTLLLAGTPYAGFNVGGAMAVVLVHPPGDPITTLTVAEWTNDTPYPLFFGSDVQNVGDLTGDGVADAAVLEPGDGSHVRRGRILVLDGAGLLDGFQPSDVLQEITDPRRTFSSSLRFLGDYDHNGSPDLAVTTSGPEQSIRIYSVVPEPAAGSTLLCAAGLLLRRRRTGA